MQTQEPLSELAFLDVSRKLLMLLALLSGQRGETLHVLKIRNICIYCVKYGLVQTCIHRYGMPKQILC